jgi:hypothetical protein
MHPTTIPALAATAPHTGLISLNAGHIGIALVVVIVCAGWAVWSVWKDKTPRLRVWLILLVGTAIAGFAVGLEQLAAASATTNTPIAAVIALGVAAFFACELWFVAHPRRPGGGGFDTDDAGGGGIRRIVHSVMATIAPTAFLAAYGVIAVAAGFGTGSVADVATTITAVL